MLHTPYDGSGGLLMTVSAKCARLAEQWRASAEAEIDAAKALRATGQNWGQVYWHAGFAIEQMLKAIRIRREGLEEWPAADRGAIWHDLEVLADRVVRADLQVACRANLTFEAYWLTVRDWSHERRYPGDTNPVTKKDGLDLLLAVINPRNGVMKWLQELYQSI
jgi:hypothetical protein